jgi:DNA-binding SARP family transcriptional activator
LTSLTVNLFGQSETTVDQQTPLSFRTAKAQALLFYLLVEPQQTFYREKLMALLWPDAALKSAQTSLRQAIYQLRHTLPKLDNLQGGPAVVLVNTTRFTVERHPHAAVFVDVAAFHNALREVDRHGHETLSGCYTCRQALEVATTLYRGPFLVNMSLHDCEPFDAWIRNWRTNLERQALDAFHTLTDLHLRDNDCEQAAALARRQLTLDPFAERALRQLLTAEARCGRRTEALADLASYCALLEKELQTTTASAPVRRFTNSLCPRSATTAFPHCRHLAGALSGEPLSWPNFSDY